MLAYFFIGLALYELNGMVDILIELIATNQAVITEENKNE
jgi:hypothetical protein